MRQQLPEISDVEALVNQAGIVKIRILQESLNLFVNMFRQKSYKRNKTRRL